MPCMCIDFFTASPRGDRATAAVLGECLSGLHLLHHLLQVGNHIVYCRTTDFNCKQISKSMAAALLALFWPAAAP